MPKDPLEGGVVVAPEDEITKPPEVPEASTVEAGGEVEESEVEVLGKRILTAMQSATSRLGHSEYFDSAAGILQLAGSLGVEFDDELSEQNLADFCEACKIGIADEAAIFIDALIIAAYGRLAIDSGSLPSVIQNRYRDPVTTYVAALELLDGFVSMNLERVQTGDAYANLPDAREFSRAILTPKGHEAIQAMLEAERSGEVVDGLGDRTVELGPPANTRILVCEQTGNETVPVIEFPTYTRAAGSIEDFPDLADRLMPDVPSADKLRLQFAKLFPDSSKKRTWPETASERTLAKLHLPADKYPDPEVIKGAKVERLVAVLPMPDSLERMEFMVEVKGAPLGPYDVNQLDVVTGEAHHTFLRQITLRRDDIERVGVPGGTSALTMLTFAVQRASTVPEDVLAKRLDPAGLAGATSILIILTPVLPAEQASKERKNITRRVATKDLVEGRIGVEDFVQILKGVGFHSSDFTALADLRDMVDERSKALFRQLLAHFPHPDSRPASSTSLLMGGEGLLTGSGYGVGGRMGVTSVMYDADPNKAPRIIELQVIGVN